MGHFRTHALQQMVILFGHLVGEREQRRRRGANRAWLATDAVTRLIQINAAGQTSCPQCPDVLWEGWKMTRLKALMGAALLGFVGLTVPLNARAEVFVSNFFASPTIVGQDQEVQLTLTLTVVNFSPQFVANDSFFCRRDCYRRS